MKNKTKVAISLLGAIAAGVVVGLMIAPDKGSATRKKIRDTTGSWVDQLGNVIAEGQDAVKERVKGFKKNSEEKIKNAREAVS